MATKLNFVKKARNDIYYGGLRMPNQENKSGVSIDRSHPRDKDDPLIVKKDESYYWWQFPYQEKRISKTQPSRSQLTQSSFYSTLWDVEDRIGAMSIISYGTGEDFKNVVDEIVADLTSLKEEIESSLENMPEGLQSGSTGELLQERINALESYIGELEGIDLDDAPEVDEESPTDEEIEELNEWLDGKIGEVQGCSCDI
jgi:hypothetical protein